MKNNFHSFYYIINSRSKRHAYMKIQDIKDSSTILNLLLNSHNDEHMDITMTASNSLGKIIQETWSYLLV
jgi:hypothetical protein